MSSVNDQFIRFGFTFVFGDDAVDFYRIGQFQLAVRKLPVAVQVGRLDGRRLSLLFHVDDRQHRNRPIPSHRFPNKKRTRRLEGSVNTTRCHMDGQFAFSLSAFLLSDTEARSVERGIAGHRFRQFLH